MATGALDSGPVGPSDTTADLDSATDSETEDESHEPCYLFSKEVKKSTHTNIKKLRLGVAAACQECSIVLDAITTYSNERLWMDSIRTVAVPADSWRIIVFTNDERGGTDLELFRIEGQELYILSSLSSSKLPIPTKTLLPGDTSSDQALQTLHNWIETCVEHHETCAGRKVSQLLKRVLEIDREHVYLREHLETPAMYACLSHCWGPSGPALKLDKTTFSDFMDGILIDQLPKTFADTVRLCLKLHFCFIWIDACCIMQDDEDDWKEAAATMAIIYERAHLTIAATWASNSDCGLFAPDGERYKARKLTAHELYILEAREFFPPATQTRSTQFPLLSRAWVYQERLLSSRMVHFGKDQIYWQCPTRFISESGITLEETYPYADPPKLNLFEVIEDPVDRWHKLVNMYSGLTLTYASDRLPAVAAIVERELRLRLDDVYIAGIWKKSLLHDLAWGTQYYTPPARCPQIRSPTWAWPSSQIQVRWESGSLEQCLGLVDLSYTHVGPAHVGEVTNASILLEGRVYTIRLKKHFEREISMLESCLEMTSHSLSDVELGYWSTRMDYDWFTGDRPVTVGDTFVVLTISLLSKRASYTGLILREVTDGVFERIGIIGIEAVSRSGMTTLQKTQIICDFVEALPIRQVKII